MDCWDPPPWNQQPEFLEGRTRHLAPLPPRAGAGGGPRAAALNAARHRTAPHLTAAAGAGTAPLPAAAAGVAARVGRVATRDSATRLN